MNIAEYGFTLMHEKLFDTNQDSTGQHHNRLLWAALQYKLKQITFIH